MCVPPLIQKRSLIGVLVFLLTRSKIIILKKKKIQDNFMEHKKAACCYFYDTLREKIHFYYTDFCRRYKLTDGIIDEEGPIVCKVGWLDGRQQLLLVVFFFFVCSS